MKKHSFGWLFAGAVILLIIFAMSRRSIVWAGTPAADARDTVVIQDEVVLVGTMPETLVVSDGGHLVMLGLAEQDIVVESGGTTILYGIVLGNVLNLGGQLEVYGIVAGYVYSDTGTATQIDPNAIVLGTPPAATPTPLPTPVPSTGTPTPVPTTIPPTPTSTALPVTGTRMIDLSLSLYKSALTAADREPYEGILEYFADGIYEMSNGAHKVRAVTIYENGRHAASADIVWNAEEWPRANTTGADKRGWRVWMGDIFPFYIPGYDALSPTNWRCSGYVLAHEWGHYFYGLYDEYEGRERTLRPSSPQIGDAPVKNSVMNDTWIACEQGDFNWLNFSIPKNQTHRNAQYRAYEASAWEMLIRPPSQDPRNGNRLATAVRAYYPELAAVAPVGNQNAAIDLDVPDAQTQARSELNIVWANGMADVSKEADAVFAPAQATPSYQGFVNSLSGHTIQYPQPVLLMAKVMKDLPIAKVEIRAGVRTPGGAIQSLTLKDDGVAPDVLSDDGLYSGFMPYAQEGDYTVYATFNNLAGMGVFTTASLDLAPGPDGEIDYPGSQPVGENFYAAAHTRISVMGLKSDDHGNTITNATSLNTDNVDVTGRIDYAGDVDMFEITPAFGGKLVLRLSGFAFGMQPAVQILREDGTQVETFEFVPEANAYFFTSIRGKALETFYVAVQHIDPAVLGGIYDISIGRALPNVTESPPLNWLLILLPLIGAVLLGLYFILRRRPAPRQVAAPRRRSHVAAPPRQARPKSPAGGSIYKRAGDAEDDPEES